MFLLCFWRNSPTRARATLLPRFLDHTQWHTTVGMTPLGEGSASRRDIYLTTHNTHNRQTFMPLAGFEYGLRPIECWNSRFKSRPGHGCPSLLSVVLSGRGLCDGPITRPEKSYRLRCVIVCDIETLRMRRPWPALGCCARKTNFMLMPDVTRVENISSCI
jgi:hypothetical protein